MSDSQLILAIDPGTEQSALLLWDGQKIRHAEKVPNGDVFAQMQVFPANLLAIEMVQSFGMPVGKEIFETVFWIGRFWEYHSSLGENIPNGSSEMRVYRSEVKLHHCGSARAKDSNIRAALIDKYGAPGTKKAPGLTYGISGDLWSAFAIATYVSEGIAFRSIPAIQARTKETLEK